MKFRRFLLALLTVILSISFLTITAGAAAKPKAPVVKASNVASSGEIKLKWDAVSGAKNYKIYRASAQDGTYEVIKTTTSTSFTNTSPDPGETYWYYVKAVSAKGAVSKASAKVSATCKLPQPKLTMSNVSDTGKIKLSWKAIDGAETYHIYRSATGKSGSFTKLSETTKTSFTNTSVGAGKVFYYKVKAIHSNSAANSAFSGAQKRTCDLPRPDVTATNVASSGKIKLSWKAVDGAKSYQVYRSATGKDGSFTKLGETTKLSYTNTSATAGKLYYYKVKAVHSNSAANSAFSPKVERTCDLAQPVLTVSNVSSSGNIKLSWKAVDAAKSYQIYRSKSKDSGFGLINTVTGTSLVNTSADVNVTYYYKIKAVSSNSNANSAFSAVKSGKIQGTYTTAYVANPTLTLYKNADGSGQSVTLKYMTKVQLGPKTVYSNGNSQKVRYNNTLYYVWNAKGSNNFTTTLSKPDYSAETRTQHQKDVVDLALTYLEVPTDYVNAAIGEVKNGKYCFDCSGFVGYVINTVIREENPMYTLSTNVVTMYKDGTFNNKNGIIYNDGFANEFKMQTVSQQNIQPGDVIFFKLDSKDTRVVDHCGIYLGKNEFIHATTAVDGVTRAPLNKSFKNKIVAVRRFFPDQVLPANQTVTANYNNLGMFDDRDTASQRLYSFTKGEEATLLYTSGNGNWGQVENQNGLRGFVLMKNVTLKTS